MKTDWSLLACVLGFEVMFAVIGTFLIWRGIKKGFVQRRYEHHGRIFEGNDAMRLGIVTILVGLFVWVAVGLMSWAWVRGRITW